MDSFKAKGESALRPVVSTAGWSAGPGCRLFYQVFVQGSRGAVLLGPRQEDASDVMEVMAHYPRLRNF